MNGADLGRLRRYDELVGRIYADTRLSAGTREAALAMAWTQYRHPEPVAEPTTSEFWRRAMALVGSGGYRPRLADLVAEDAPRYELPLSARGHSGACEGPRQRPYRRRNEPPPDPNCKVYVGQDYVQPSRRDDRVCGASATIKVLERDMVTGWVCAHWFCRRHADRAGQVRAQIEALGGPPDPVPNTGGLLPCYFSSDWERIYAHYRHGWQPPYHGICADDWPTPNARHVPRPPRLAIVVNGG